MLRIYGLVNAMGKASGRFRPPEKKMPKYADLVGCKKKKQSETNGAICIYLQPCTFHLDLYVCCVFVCFSWQLKGLAVFRTWPIFPKPIFPWSLSCFPLEKECRADCTLSL